MPETSSPAASKQSRAPRLVTAITAALALVLGPLTASPAHAAEVGSISGRVVDTTTGTPLPTVSVLVRPIGDDNAEPIVANGTNGIFTVPDVPVGQYSVEFRDDFGGEHLSEFYDDARVAADADPVAVTAGAVTALGDVGLDRGASLSGVVTSDGQAIAGATVEALVVIDGQTGQERAASLTTTADGRYSLAHLPAGTYRIKVSRAGHFDVLSDATALGVGQDLDLGTIALEKTAGIVGTVQNSAGDGLANITVEAFPVAGGVVATQGTATTTAIDGTFAIPNLRGGAYRLRFRDAAGAYQERFDVPMQIEGGENGADTDVVVLARVAPIVPPAPYRPPVTARKSASVKVKAKGAKKKATLTITVRASGATPTGKVTIKLGRKTLKTVTLKRGKATVTIKKQKKGKRTYKVTYSGDSRVLGRTVTTQKVRIR